MPREQFIAPHRLPTGSGKMLLQELLEPSNSTITVFAKAVGGSGFAVSEILNRRRGVSPLTALRFSKVPGSTQQFLLTLQVASDIHEANRSADEAEIAKSKSIEFFQAA